MPMLRIRSKKEMKEYLTRETDGHEPSDAMVDILYRMVDLEGVNPANVLAAYDAGVLVGRAKREEELVAACVKHEKPRKRYPTGNYSGRH